MCLGEHFSWERKSTEEFKILDSDDVIIWCFCGKRKIRFSHKNSKEYCVLWVNCAIKLLEERTAQRRWEKKSVQWWSRHVYYYYLRKFPDRNLSVCLNHKIHPYIYPPSPVLILKCSNDSEFQVTELRVPRVSTKAVTKFSQRKSFWGKWQPLIIEISLGFFYENEVKAIQGLYSTKNTPGIAYSWKMCFLQRWMFSTFGASKNTLHALDEPTVKFL